MDQRTMQILFALLSSAIRGTKLTESKRENYSSDMLQDLLKISSKHGNARRRCMEACSYDLVALMDADDICVKNRFEKQIEVFKNNPEISVVGGQIHEFIDSADNMVGKRVVPLIDSEKCIATEVELNILTARQNFKNICLTKKLSDLQDLPLM